MAKPRNKVLDYLTYLAMRAMVMFLHMFGPHCSYVLAGWAGDLLWRFDRKHRCRAVEHLRRSFPDWTEEHINDVGKASMRSVVYLAVEMLFTTRLITPETWRRHVRLNNVDEMIRVMLERKSGAIFVTGHFGNWEVLGYTIATVGFPNYAVARPMDNPYINQWVLGVREKQGLRIIDKKGAMGSLDDILQAGGCLGFIADQDAGRKGAFVDFFGRPASTFKAIALLAMRHEAPILVGYARRLDTFFNFEIGVQRIIFPCEWAEKDDPMIWITQEYTLAIEQLARGAPEQYLWAHRRWKHRPKGSPAAVDGIA